MEITWRFDSPDAIQDVAASNQSCDGQIPPGLIRVKLRWQKGVSRWSLKCERYLTLFLTGRGHYGPTNLKLFHHFNTIRARLTKTYDFVAWYVGVDWFKPCFICFWIFWKIKTRKFFTPWLVRWRGVFDLLYLTGRGHYGPIFCFFIWESLENKQVSQKKTKLFVFDVYLDL